MKLSTVWVLGALAFTSSNVFAKTVVFEKKAENFETQACYTAATQGMDAAEALFSNSQLNFTTGKNLISCNGMSLVDFSAKYYHNSSTSEQVLPIIELTAVSQTPETQLCVDAALIGEKEARVKHDLEGASIKCNGQSLSTFLKKLKNRKIAKSTNQQDIVA